MIVTVGTDPGERPRRNCQLYRAQGQTQTLTRGRRPRILVVDIDLRPPTGPRFHRWCWPRT